MKRAVGLLGLALLIGALAPIRAGAQEVWTCTLTESHHFTGGRDVTQKGGGDYRLAVKPPAIDLTANGTFIIGYDIAENSRNRLLGQRSFDAGGGETVSAKLALDKLNGRIVQTGISQKNGSEELVEVINARCKASQ